MTAAALLRPASGRARFMTVVATIAVLLAALLALALTQGAFGASALQALASLASVEGRQSELGFVVMELRLPRALTAILVGLAFGLSGALMQAVLRNPLADPGILGINGGAALAAVMVVIVFRDLPAWILPWAALLGAAATTMFIYLFAWRDGVQPLGLVLIGIGVAAFLGGLTSLVSTFGRIEDVQRAMIWLAGSVYGRSWDDVAGLALWSVVLTPAALLSWRRLDLMTLGDDSAAGLGMPVEATRAMVIALATALAASAVAAAGTIGFIGLVAPHLARRLVGAGHARMLPVAALLGGLIVLAADGAGQWVVAPAQLPAGVMTAILGGPYFMYLLWTRSKA